MNNVLAIVNLHNAPSADSLTNARELASTTFMGRYAFIDFVLSNLLNSGIDDISILTKSRFRSVSKHIGASSTYLRNTRTGFLNILINEKDMMYPQHNTDIHNLEHNDYILYDSTCKYCIICPAHIVLKANYQNILDEHIKSGKKVSILYKKTKEVGEYLNCDRIVIDSLGNAQKFESVNTEDEEINVSLQTYIVNMDYLKKVILRSKEISELYTLDDILKYLAYNEDEMHCIEHKGYARCFNSFNKYFKYSFEIMDKKNGGEEVFSENELLLTTTHNSRPVLYGENSDVKECLIANGCTINGKVKHSILARDVIIEEGASVENCILFTHTVVKKGVHLKNVVSDKRCVFKTKANVAGSDDEPLYIQRGAII